MELDLAREKVAYALTALETGIDRLVNSLAHSAANVQLESPPGDTDPIRVVGEAYSSINYGMEDQVEDSVVCLGVLGVGADLLAQAATVNSLKAELKALSAPLRGVQVRVRDKGRSSSRKISAMRAILRSLQRSDLNLLAAYRKIPILEVLPASITYTRAVTRAVYRKSIEDLYVLLTPMEGPIASSDRARLSTLNPRETHLAFVKDHYQNVRANVLYSHLDARGRGRVQIAAELPIIYRKSRYSEAPQVQFPATKIPTRPARVRQSKLEPEPFLDSIPVYRYSP